MTLNQPCILTKHGLFINLLPLTSSPSLLLSNLSRQRICLSSILKLAKLEGVQVLTRNNRSTGPESKQKRLPDLCPRCQSPNHILRNLSLCSRQHVSDQMIDLCSLRNLKEGINDLVNKQAGRYRRKLNNPVTVHNCSSLSFWIYFPYIYVFSDFMIK